MIGHWLGRVVGHWFGRRGEAIAEPAQPTTGGGVPYPRVRTRTQRIDWRRLLPLGPETFEEEEEPSLARSIPSPTHAQAQPLIAALRLALPEYAAFLVRERVRLAQRRRREEEEWVLLRSSAL